MECIQNIFNACDNYAIHISNGIYKAPLIINRKCKIYGHNSVILCSDGNNVIADCSGIELHDFRIETTAENTDLIPVLQYRTDTVMKNICVRGNIKKNDEISDASGIPKKFSLGRFKADTENMYNISINVPENSSLHCDIDGIKIYPETLQTGRNTVTIKTDALRDGISVFGKIYIISAITREIYLYGQSDKSVDIHNIQKTNNTENPTSDYSVYTPPDTALPPKYSDESIINLKRGQRINLNNNIDSVQIQFVCDGTDEKIDIDGYTFIVQNNGKVNKEEDMIFWGNKQSSDNSVRLTDDSDNSHFSVYLSDLPEYAKKIAFCYSVYGDEQRKNFKMVHNPYIRIFLDNIETYRFPLSELGQEKTIVAVEIYKYQEKWKINCIGAGYHAGLRRMCEDYGIEIAD
ncbi:MAG: TerD family protein [Ruminococcus sp.]|nr:TerD family protein [Ruminococcus sp.]